MKLSDFLDKEGVSPPEFSERLGLKSKSSVYRYLSGARRPGPEIMPKIVTATNGQVTANDFYE